MFKQFLGHAQGTQVYLLASLGIFLLFFIVVTILMFRLRKQHIVYMSDMPLADAEPDQPTIARL